MTVKELFFPVPGGEKLREFRRREKRGMPFSCFRLKDGDSRRKQKNNHGVSGKEQPESLFEDKLTA